MPAPGSLRACILPRALIGAAALVAAASAAADDLPPPAPLDKAPALLSDTSVVSVRVPAVVPPGFEVPITLVNHTAETISVYARCADDVVQDESGATFDVSDHHRYKKWAMPTDELGAGEAKQLCVWDQQVEADDASGVDRVALAPGRYRYVLTVEPRGKDGPLGLAGYPNAWLEISNGTPLALDTEHTLAQGTLVHVADAAMYLRLDHATAANGPDGTAYFGAGLTIFHDGESHPVMLSLGDVDAAQGRTQIGEYLVSVRDIDGWSATPSATLIVSRVEP